MKRAIPILLSAALVLSAAAMLTACRRSSTNSVSVVGSTSVQPFAEMLGQDYSPDIEVQGGGSTAGVTSTLKGMADIGMCSRDLKDSEKSKLRAIEIARDGLAIVVHRDNPIKDLTLEQAAKLFSGEITDWGQVGGTPGRPVRAITREEGSGTREAFMTKVMVEPFTKRNPPQHEREITPYAVTQESNGAVIVLVEGNRDAIGYISLGLVKGHKLRAVPIRTKGGRVVAPSSEAVQNHTYPLWRPFNFVVKKDQPVPQKAQKFIDYVLSDKGQDLLVRKGLVPAPRKGRADK